MQNQAAKRPVGAGAPLRPGGRAGHLLACCLVAGIWLAGPVCAPAATNAAPRVERMSHGPIEIVITADPPQVRLDRDILLVIRTGAPSNIAVRLPPIDNRLTGFTLSGAFDREPASREGIVTREHCFRLTPLVAAEYRLGPIAVTYADERNQELPEMWFATRPMVFEALPIADSRPGSAAGDIRGPVWIYPAFQTVAAWIGLLLLAVAAALALFRLSRRIRRAIRLRRMSPRERALAELAELMARDLIAQDRVMDFFIELTQIVRRYIERAHRIRAPEQTTEEFLLAAARNPQFREEVLAKLRLFLQTADLVKFAAYRPAAAAVERALGTARDYVETDGGARAEMGAG